MIDIASVYLSINALIFLYLSIRVVGVRRREKISLGVGNSDDLQRTVRAFGNNSEYLPVVILLMAGLEIKGASAWALHVMGISYTLGRILHALAIYKKIKSIYRVVGMAITYTLILISAVWLMILVF